MDKQRPHIIVIFGDDIGYGDFACYNPESKIPTPHIDELAGEGMRFTDAHSASAVCTPSRYGLLTGQYCFRSPLKRSVLCGYEPPLIEQGRETVASLLQSVGYRTACIGKWHVGMGFHAKPGETLDFGRQLPWGVPTREFEEKIDFSRPMFGGPTDLGFDTFFGTVGCSTCQPPYAFVEGDAFTTGKFHYDDSATPQKRPGMTAEGWDNKEADLRFVERAVSVIRESARENAPLFMYLCPSAAHEPCTEEDTPEIARGRSSAGHRGDLVWLFDYMVGQVVGALKETGMWDNTLLLVTSDNGGLPGDRLPVPEGSKDAFAFESYGHKANGDLRGYKSHIWEGGHREPLVVTWPGHVQPGSLCAGPVCLTDFYETFREIVGAPRKTTGGEDSFSMLDMLLDPDAPARRDHIIHHSQTGVFSLREGDWKLIFECVSSGGWPPPTDRKSPVPGGPGQLYNLKDDPAEEHNLYAERPDIVSRMAARLMAFKNAGRSA